MVATLGLMPKKTNTIRLRPDYIRRLNRLAGHHDKSTPDYLAELLGPALDAAEDQMAKDLEAERKALRLPPPPPPSPRKPSSRRGESSP